MRGRDISCDFVLLARLVASRPVARRPVASRPVARRPVASPPQAMVVSPPLGILVVHILHWRDHHRRIHRIKQLHGEMANRQLELELSQVSPDLLSIFLSPGRPPCSTMAPGKLPTAPHSTSWPGTLHSSTPSRFLTTCPMGGL